ncbi:MAG: hypothetical protein ABEJ78_04065 [Haloferacaceae archaeon]
MVSVDAGVGRLLVVDDGGELAGLLSLRPLARVRNLAVVAAEAAGRRGGGTTPSISRRSAATPISRRSRRESHEQPN